MIIENLIQDFEPGYNLIEHEKCNNLTIGFNYRHGLGPLSRVVYDHDNMLMPPSRSWVAIHKIHPLLGEGTDDDDWVKRGWMRAYLLSEHLERVTLLDHFDAIFKTRQPKIIGPQYLLGFRKLE
jgi:hypothetical protein